MSKMLSHILLFLALLQMVNARGRIHSHPIMINGSHRWYHFYQNFSSYQEGKDRCINTKLKLGQVKSREEFFILTDTLKISPGKIMLFRLISKFN